jgi:hypothetical protein
MANRLELLNEISGVVGMFLFRLGSTIVGIEKYVAVPNNSVEKPVGSRGLGFGDHGDDVGPRGGELGGSRILSSDHLTLKDVKNND